MPYSRIGKIAPLCAVALSAAAPAHADLSISNRSTKNVSCANGICAATAKNAVLNIRDLTALLGAGDVKVIAASVAQDIRVDAPLGWSSANVLTIDAARSVVVNNTIDVEGTGGLAVTTNDGGINGIFSFGAMGRIAFENLTSTLTVDAQGYSLVGNIGTLANDIASNPSGNFALANNYDASGNGAYTAPPVPTRFTGAFEGLGNTISNLTIDVAGGTNVGLFADSAGMLADIRFANASVTGEASQDASPTGALAGLNEGTIEGASTSGSVSGTAGNYPYVGGLVGSSLGTITRSHSTANVTAGNSGVTGGLVGNAESGMIYASSAMGAVSSGQGGEAGGLVGANGGQITHSFSTGAVASGVESKAGGFVGYDSGPISDCYATGSASQQGDLGYSSGFVGFFQPAGTNLLTRNYSTGAPSGGNLIGGFIGDDMSSGINLAYNYWDMTTSGLGSADGAGNPPNDPGIEGLTSHQLEARLPQHFKQSTWVQSRAINNGFPYLRANPPGA